MLDGVRASEAPHELASSCFALGQLTPWQCAAKRCAGALPELLEKLSLKGAHQGTLLAAVCQAPPKQRRVKRQGGQGRRLFRLTYLEQSTHQLSRHLATESTDIEDLRITFSRDTRRSCGRWGSKTKTQPPSGWGGRGLLPVGRAGVAGRGPCCAAGEPRRPRRGRLARRDLRRRGPKGEGALPQGRVPRQRRRPPSPRAPWLHSALGPWRAWRAWRAIRGSGPPRPAFSLGCLPRPCRSLPSPAVLLNLFCRDVSCWPCSQRVPRTANICLAVAALGADEAAGGAATEPGDGQRRLGQSPRLFGAPGGPGPGPGQEPRPRAPDVARAGDARPGAQGPGPQQPLASLCWLVLWRIVRLDWISRAESFVRLAPDGALRRVSRPESFVQELGHLKDATPGRVARNVCFGVCFV